MALEAIRLVKRHRKVFFSIRRGKLLLCEDEKTWGFLKPPPGLALHDARPTAHKFYSLALALCWEISVPPLKGRESFTRVRFSPLPRVRSNEYNDKFNNRLESSSILFWPAGGRALDTGPASRRSFRLGGKVFSFYLLHLFILLILLGPAR